MQRIALTVLAGALILAIPVSAATGPIQILIFDGDSSQYHNWQMVTKVLKKELEDAGIFQVTVTTAPKSDGDFSNFKPEFSKYQAVVFNYDAPDWPSAMRAQLEDYVKNGGGLVIVHAADNSFPDWRDFNLMTGIGGWRKRTEKAGPMWYFKDGKLISDPSPGNAGAHGARLPFQVTARDTQHPIM